MNIDNHAIESTDQIQNGDNVVLVTTNRGKPTSIAVAQVTRKLKTKFEVTYREGSKDTYNTNISFGSLVRYGSGGRTPFSTVRTIMYPINDEVKAWCAHQGRKMKANSLRIELGDLAYSHRFNEAGKEETLNTIREIAHMAQQLLEMEELIAQEELAYTTD